MNLPDLPDALEPVYPINQVGEPITLYEGSIEVVQEDQTITVDNAVLSKENLKKFRGYAITDIGKIISTQSNTFTGEEILKILDILRYFLSFTRGFWVAPILITGFDADNNKIWEHWDSFYKIDRWGDSQFSWLPSPDYPGIYNLEAAFSGFWQKWKNETWQEPIQLAIKWYIESNKSAGGEEGSIIFIQSALEMLSYVLLVEDKKIILKNFEKLDSSDKLSLLLSQCGIPLEIPSHLAQLCQFAKSHNHTQGAEVLSYLRNRITHPTLKHRTEISKTSYKVIWEAWLLGRWYLELTILSLFNYKGNYMNFTKLPVGVGTAEPVPWATGNQNTTV